MQKYTVPVLQADLRHEETILQAVNSLSQLQSVINNIFDRIEWRIEQNSIRIHKINQRLDVANAKGQQLVGLRQATKVLSPPEYTESQCTNIAMTFNGTIQSAAPPFGDYCLSGKLDPVGQRSAVEKLQFFHVHKFDETPRSQWNGLGAQPSFLDSVDSLLSFTSPQYVYGDNKACNIANRHGITKNHYKSLPSKCYDRLGSAPPSISNQKMHLHKRQSDIAFYTPSKNDAPLIELPMDLPDLPGIADNVVFSSTHHAHVHAITTGSMYLSDLPDFPDLDLSNTDLSSADVLAANIADIDCLIPPPPPPPHPLPRTTEAVSAKRTIVDSSNMPPPPPPPPIQPVATYARPQPDAVVTVNTDRSNLLDAIRKAGGKSTLRPTTQDTPPIVSRPATSGGNLMDDLHQKLTMRRKGISGNKDTKLASDNGLMNRISALIPPPPQVRPKETSSGTSDEEDEWN